MTSQTLELRDGVVAALLRTFLAHPITGCLIVQGPDGARGHIHITSGRLVHATTNSRDGLNALSEMLSWRAGMYSLEEGAVAPTHTLNLTLEQLLKGVAVQLAPIQALPSLEALLEERSSVEVRSYGSEHFVPDAASSAETLEPQLLEQADEAFNAVWDQPDPAPRGFFAWFAQVLSSVQGLFDARHRAR